MSHTVGKILTCTRAGGTYVVIGKRGNKRYRFTGYHMGPVQCTEFTSEVFAETDGLPAPFEDAPGPLRRKVSKVLGITLPKKPRTFFTSKEIAHVWANEGAPEGNSPGNMSFNGAAFYSYGTTIARIIKHRGKKAYLFESAGFSSSTSHHQGCARSAVAQEEKKFFVCQGRRGQSLDFTPAKLRDYYIGRFKEVQNQDSPKAHVRAEDVVRRGRALSNALDVCHFFKLPTKRLANMEKKFQQELDEASEIVQAYEEKRKVIREERDRKRQAKAIEQAVEKAQAFLRGETDSFYGLDLLKLGQHDELYRQAEAHLLEVNQQKIERWLAGDPDVHLDYELPIMLRVAPDDGSAVVETSRGARVPLTEAERTYRFILKVHDRGWHASGEQHQVGMYALKRVLPDEIVVGCHHIAWSEVERFAKSQGWSQ